MFAGLALRMGFAMAGAETPSFSFGFFGIAEAMP